MQNLKQRVLAVERKSSNSHNTSTSTPSSTARGKQDSKPQITQSTHHASSTNGSTRRLSIQAPQPVEVESIQMKVGRLTIKKTRVIQNQVSTSNNKTSHLKIVRNPRFGKGSIFNQNRPSISLQSKLSESIRPSNSNQIVKDANGKWVKVEQSVQPKRKIALSTIQSNLQSSKSEARNHSSVIEQEIEDEQPQQLQQHEEPEYIDEEEDEEEQYSEQQDQAFGQAPNDEYDDNQYEGQEVELDNQSDNFYEEEEPVKQVPEYSTKYIVALNNLSRKSTANDIRRLIEPSEKNYIEDIQMELLHGKRVEGQILRADPAEISVEDQIESKQPVQPEPRSQPQTNKSTAPTQVQPDHSQRKPQQSHREVPALPDSNTYVQQQKNIISQHLKQNTDSRSSSHKYEPQQQTHDQARSTTKQNTQPALSSKNAPPPSSQSQQQQQSQVPTSSTRANQNQYEEQRSRPQTSRSNQQETPNSRSTNNSRQNVQENNRQQTQQTNNYTKETNQQNQSSNRREQQQNNDNQRFQNRNNTKNDSPNYQRSESPQNYRNQNRNQERQRSRSPPSHVKPERRHQPEEINRNQRYVHRSPQRENTQRRRQSIESPPRRNQEVRRNSNERSSRQPERQQQHHSSNNRSNHVTRR